MDVSLTSSVLKNDNNKIKQHQMLSAWCVPGSTRHSGEDRSAHPHTCARPCPTYHRSPALLSSVFKLPTTYSFCSNLFGRESFCGQFRSVVLTLARFAPQRTFGSVGGVFFHCHQLGERVLLASVEARGVVTYPGMCRTAQGRASPSPNVSSARLRSCVGWRASIITTERGKPSSRCSENRATRVHSGQRLLYLRGLKAQQNQPDAFHQHSETD